MDAPNSHAHIRSHPEMYLSGGQLDPSDFATRLAGDALTQGASRTLAVHRDAWWLVAADVDWLAAAPVGPKELFARIVPFPQAGPNSMRSEVLLGAFADEVVTWNSVKTEVIVGESSDETEWLRQMIDDPLWVRVVAFRFEPARLKRSAAEAAIAE